MPTPLFWTRVPLTCCNAVRMNSTRRLLAAGFLVVIAGCGIRNLGESCPFGPAGDFLCGPGVCGHDPEHEDQGICVECLNDLDCLKVDAFDRPRCIKGLPPSEGGDGLPFCKHITDHPSCDLPGVGAAVCGPNKCHPDAGVCVECLKDGDCPPDRKVCDPGSAPDFLPFCRAAE